MPDKSPSSTHGRFKQRKNTSAYSESGGFLSHDARPLSRETITASSFRHTPRENPQDCDSRESFTDLPDIEKIRHSGRTTEESPRSPLDNVSVFERDSLDGSDEDEQVILSSSRVERQSTPLPMLQREESKEDSPKSKSKGSSTHIDLESDSSDMSHGECEYSDSEDDEEDESSEGSNEEEHSESGSRMSSRIGSRMENNLKGKNVF